MEDTAGDDSTEDEDVSVERAGAIDEVALGPAMLEELGVGAMHLVQMVEVLVIKTVEMVWLV